MENGPFVKVEGLGRMGREDALTYVRTFPPITEGILGSGTINVISEGLEGCRQCELVVVVFCVTRMCIIEYVANDV